MWFTDMTHEMRSQQLVEAAKVNAANVIFRPISSEASKELSHRRSNLYVHIHCITP